jgi:cellulose synthase/poly-beta-1,6-N-acetylglucosamine synthase-like glycosyltransferase
MDGEISRSYDPFTAAFETNRLPVSASTDLLFRCIVAIPVKNEAERLPACLAALADQRDRLGRPVDREAFGIVVFANNCTDGSGDLARALGNELSLPLRVVEISLMPGAAHAGNARRGAMDAALDWLAERSATGGVILTTDADSRVSPDWIASNLAAIRAGADMVLGQIRLDGDGDLLPEALHRRGQLESEYEALLTELTAHVDPLPYDPWPRHATISGASVAITRKIYEEVGGLPRVPLGEDKALVAALIRIDARIRHAPEVSVMTSGRCYGRAPGGVADTLRLRSSDPDALCDEALEPFHVALRRAKWRRRLRKLWCAGDLMGNDPWMRALQISDACALQADGASTFGAAWSEIELNSPRLSRRPLLPAELPGQILLARRALDRLRGVGLSPRQEVQAEPAMSLGPLDRAGSIHGGDEEIGCLIPG